MATVTINAEYAASHCKARLEEIDAKYEADKEEWFKGQRTRPRRRGVWPFRYSYYPTEYELKRAFHGLDEDWHSIEYVFQRRSSKERATLNGIVEAASVAKKAGKLDITLDADEIARLNAITGEPLAA